MREVIDRFCEADQGWRDIAGDMQPSVFVENEKTAAQAAQQKLDECTHRARQLIAIQGKITGALAPRGFGEWLARIIPVFRTTANHRQIERLCALASSDALIGTLFEDQVYNNNDPQDWAARMKLLMHKAKKDKENAGVLCRVPVEKP